MKVNLFSVMAVSSFLVCGISHLANASENQETQSSLNMVDSSWLDEATGMTWYLQPGYYNTNQSETVCEQQGMRKPRSFEIESARPRILASPLSRQIPMSKSKEGWFGSDISYFCPAMSRYKYVFVDDGIPPGGGKYKILHDLLTGITGYSTTYDMAHDDSLCERGFALICVR